MAKNIGLLGKGGHASEVKYYAEANDLEVIFNAVDHEYINGNEIDILKPSNEQKDIQVMVAVGAPEIRREMVKKWPGDNFATIIARGVIIGDRVSIAEGSLVAPGVVLTCDIKVGKHSIINIASTISHGCSLGDYVTVCPGVHVAGNVSLGDGVFVGIGANINNNIKIANGVVIGAGALIIEDIMEENSVYVGVPARKVNINNGWLRDV